MKTQMENTKRLNSNLRKNITFYEMTFTSAMIGCLQVLKIDTKIAVRGDKEKTGNMNRNKLYPKYYRLVLKVQFVISADQRRFQFAIFCVFVIVYFFPLSQESYSSSKLDQFFCSFHYC